MNPDRCCLNCDTTTDPDARRVHLVAECPWRPHADPWNAAPSPSTPPADVLEQQDDELDEDGMTATDRMVAKMIWDGVQAQYSNDAVARGVMDGFEPRTMAQQIVASLASRRP